MSQARIHTLSAPIGQGFTLTLVIVYIFCVPATFAILSLFGGTGTPR